MHLAVGVRMHLYFKDVISGKMHYLSLILKKRERETNEYISSGYWICQLHSSTSHVTHILVIMDSSFMRQDYILPDTPPHQQQSTSFPSYWAVQAAPKKKLPSANSSAAPAAAAASDCEDSPLKSRGVFVERGMSSEEFIVPDTPPSHLKWAPRRVPLTTISNKQQGKRKLHFLEEDEEETNFVHSKKQRAYEGDNSSMVPLLEEEAARDDQNQDDFIAIINRPTAKPWMPLHDLAEDVPHSIISAREETNHHGRRIILKMNISSTKKISEVYLPQRFSFIISPVKVI
ncbi:uncharacterized protein LOC120351335 [Nilaparvata lugens]|uniref:uncharacterized protein LOC120351335 n=1 Tax=Nilaparvata lugens TaxID=108931 RepID=UPI00193CD529|nr:uncharacterized protein LOC120351335 [Nilaparvata lugens]